MTTVGDVKSWMHHCRLYTCACIIHAHVRTVDHRASTSQEATEDYAQRLIVSMLKLNQRANRLCRHLYHTNVIIEDYYEWFGIYLFISSPFTVIFFEKNEKYKIFFFFTEMLIVFLRDIVYSI